MSYTREQVEQVLNDFYIHNDIPILENGLISDFLNHKFPKLPKRGWLKHTSGSIIFRTGSMSGYGWSKRDGWEVAYDYTFDIPQNWQPATEEKVNANIRKRANL
jgi:hypothetical protein